MFEGTATLTVSGDTLRAALQDYIDKHIKVPGSIRVIALNTCTSNRGSGTRYELDLEAVALPLLTQLIRDKGI